MMNKSMFWLCLAMVILISEGRPLVRNIRSTREFDMLLEKHGSETGLPVVVDFYSDSCGPCRMMAPVYKQLAKEIGQDKAVFVKVDTNAQYELSSRYQIRSLPTFAFFVGGSKKPWNQFSGAGEGQLRQMTQQAVRQAELDNVLLELQDLKEFYAKVDASKSGTDIETVYKKCATMKDPRGDKCVGPAANQLVRRLRQKYKSTPTTRERFTDEDRKPSAGGENSPKNEKNTGSTSSKTSSGGKPDKPNLHLATKEQLMKELDKRLEQEQEEAEDDEDDDEAFGVSTYSKGDFPEKVVIIGGGPAGMSAALYAARAGLRPVVICPPMGGQLQGKGVDVENYPGLHNVTGPAVVSAMRAQAATFGAVFEHDIVVSVDASKRPLVVKTNTTSGAIETHSIIVATGAESNWLGIPGEYEMRGGGVSSCATCDGAVYRNKHVIVVGGGDSAMEDALVLARTSSKVTVVHRRDAFRASKVLAQRVMEHPTISIVWDTVVQEILGRVIDDDDNEDTVDMDEEKQKVVQSVKLFNTKTSESSILDVDAVFVAIGHSPTTHFLSGIVEFDESHPGYIKTVGRSTKTSVAGIFAAGDVTDAIYRQAITSAGSGAAAALDAERYLSEEGLGNEEAEFEAELMAELLNGSSSNADASQDAVYNVYADAGGRVHHMKESLSGEL